MAMALLRLSESTVMNIEHDINCVVVRFVHVYVSFSVLEAIFLGEPGLASFIGAKDDGSDSHNWSYKTCKAPVKSSPPTSSFFQARCPSCCPVNSVKAPKYLYAIFICVSLICLCVPHPFMFPWAVGVISLTVFGVSVTNLNEPPRALATSTIAWVRSQLHPFWAVVNKSNAG